MIFLTPGPGFICSSDSSAKKLTRLFSQGYSLLSYIILAYSTVLIRFLLYLNRLFFKDVFLSN